MAENCSPLLIKYLTVNEVQGLRRLRSFFASLGGLVEVQNEISQVLSSIRKNENHTHVVLIDNNITLSLAELNLLKGLATVIAITDLPFNEDKDLPTSKSVIWQADNLLFTRSKNFWQQPILRSGLRQICHNLGSVDVEEMFGWGYFKKTQDLQGKKKSITGFLNEYFHQFLVLPEQRDAYNKFAVFLEKHTTFLGLKPANLKIISDGVFSSFTVNLRKLPRYKKMEKFLLVDMISKYSCPTTIISDLDRETLEMSVIVFFNGLGLVTEEKCEFFLFCQERKNLMKLNRVS